MEWKLERRTPTSDADGAWPVGPWAGAKSQNDAAGCRAWSAEISARAGRRVRGGDVAWWWSTWELMGNVNGPRMVARAFGETSGHDLLEGFALGLRSRRSIGGQVAPRGWCSEEPGGGVGRRQAAGRDWRNAIAGFTNEAMALRGCGRKRRWGSGR